MTPGREAALVSVVIPCHNAEAWIAETLDSVAAQRDVTCEVIVVDDGSTDASARVAESVGGRHVRLLRQEPQGVGAARNAGTAVARGAYLQYLDADDILAPGAVRARVTALDASGADVAYSDWVRWERQADGTFEVGRFMTRKLGPRPDVDLLTDAWWPPGALLYRRTFVDKILPWRTDLPVIQDARFQLDAALSGARFVHVTGVGLKYRVHGQSSLSQRDPKAFALDCYHNAAELHDRWRQGGGLDDERRHALVAVYEHVARSVFQLDRSRFAEVVERLKTLEPRFRPAGPPALRALSGVVGYPAAEQIAAWWRQVKGAVGARS
ncbi:MAG: glycosyltransferase family 2 protein [Vicinamibacterales bacterium]